MRTKKIVNGFLFVVFLIMVSFGIFQETSVQATTDDNVLNEPPVGLTLDKYFVKGTFNGNSATVIKNSNNVDIVRLTNGINQTGSIWSDSDNTNYLDVTKKQTISMWMYFGLTTTEFGTPDGMAFVLQNDKNGAGAISSYTFLGQKHINNGQSLGVWGMDYNSIVTPDMMASQAIQRSFAIEFDTYLNRNTQFNWKPDDPGTLNGRGSSFDTMPYNDDLNNYLKGSHIAWNYPAKATTYRQLSSSTNSIIGMYHNLGSNLLTNGANADFSYRKTPTNTYKEGWKHMTIEYVPDGTGKGANVHYSYRDKNVDGTAKAPEIEATAHIDLSVFELGTSHKLRYGFTASTGPNTDITNAVVFESMPSLVNAEANAYTVDKTTKTRISTKNAGTGVESNQNDNLFDDEANNLTTSKTVHPDDVLTLNYMFHYLSGEESTNGVQATVNVPSNVTITPDADGNIGTIYYVGNGTTKKVKINKTSLSGSVLKSKIENLGVGVNDWSTARIELNATANSLPANTTSLPVPGTINTFEGKNIKIDVQSDPFNIVKPANSLIITTSMSDPTIVQLGNKFNLTGQINFKNPGPVVNKNDMYIYYQVDNQAAVRTKDTSAGNTFTIYDLLTGTATGQLGLGDHTIKVQVVDYNYPNGSNIDTISSNVLEYHIKVTNQSVVVTPSKNEITVNNNEPLELTGTYLHADGTSTAAEGGTSVISYTITNAGGVAQKVVSNSQTNNGKYSITLKPYAYDKDASVSLDDYTGTTGLKVGKNVVSINVVDKEGHKSVSKDVIVNVPDIQPSLTTDQAAFNIVQGDAIKLTANTTYDKDYQVTPSKLTWYINANGHKIISSLGSNTPIATPMSQDFTIDSTANGIESEANNPYPISIYFTDPYGRKSTVLNYNVNVMEKTATIESTDYKFKNINASNSPRVVRRDGTWNLQVKSVMSKWTLTAKAGRMITGAGTSNPVTLDGNLIYISPDSKVSDMSNQTFIQNNTDDSKVKVTDIGGSWSPDQGILLDVNSSTLAGTYSGEVEWDLTNSV